jgi:adenylate kinase
MGDVLRKHAQEGTEIGKLIAKCQNEGRLADDKIVSLALLEHLKELKCREINKNNATEFGFILDGFPRTVPQAKLLLNNKEREKDNTTNDLDLVKLIEWPQDLTASFAVNIEVPDEICITKMKGRRKCSKCNESFNVSNVDTPEGFFMPPQLPVPYPCDNCDMKKDWTIRMDDTEEIFVKRMKEYHEQSAIVKQFFEDQGKLLEFTPYKGVSDMPILEKIVREKAKSCNLR